MALKSHSDSGEWIELIRCLRDAKIAAAVELDIFRQQKFEAGVNRSNPASVTLGAGVAEKFQVAAQLADDRVIHTDRVDKIFVVAAILNILHKADRCLQAHVKIVR